MGGSMEGEGDKVWEERPAHCLIPSERLQSE